MWSNATEVSRRLSTEYVIRYVEGRNIKVTVKKFEATGFKQDAPRSVCPKTATKDKNTERLLVSLEKEYAKNPSSVGKNEHFS